METEEKNKVWILRNRQAKTFEIYHRWYDSLHNQPAWITVSPGYEVTDASGYPLDRIVGRLGHHWYITA